MRDEFHDKKQVLWKQIHVNTSKQKHINVICNWEEVIWTYEQDRLRSRLLKHKKRKQLHKKDKNLKDWEL